MSDLVCAREERRRAVREAPQYGLDYVEVADGSRGLEVFFLGRAPKQIHAANVQISGGHRVRDIRVTGVRVHRQKDPTLDDWMEVEVDPFGDASEYTLRLLRLDDHGRPTTEPMEGFDPVYSSVAFSFTAGCPTNLDCKQPPVCPPPERAKPDINYLAKDYDSFRQLILDRLALTMPDWKEVHIPDIGIVLVELLAYVGDYLSYYQDAVATEAYLATARQRISVRRHVRLIDYRMHEGCNARAWIAIETDAPIASFDTRQIFFTTALPGKPEQRMFQIEELRRVPAGSYEIFEPLVVDPAQPIVIRQSHSEIHFYTWGDTECCLASGATSATLVDRWVAAEGGPRAAAAEHGDAPTAPSRALQLNVDDVLIIEEVIGPDTGTAADADPAHRQAVRLTKVTPTVDPLYDPTGSGIGQPLVEIEWCAEDALTFPLCVSARMPAPDCTVRTNISVARGNIVLVDHGATTSETPLGTVPADSVIERCACECEPPHVETTPGRFCPTLNGRPLTFAQTLPPCGCASTLVAQDPRQALPQIQLDEAQTPLRAGRKKPRRWTPALDLLESGPRDANFVVEIDDDGDAHLRFGDGDLGRMPQAGTVFDARYRIGNGRAGNVGAETITCVVFRQAGQDAAFTARNPLPAVGGTEPEPTSDVKLLAPGAFRTVLERAVTADDYAALASDNARRAVERIALAPRALAGSAPPHADPVDRAAIEEEPGEEPTIGPEICHAVFRRLQGARARLRWTGSAYEVLVALDPLGTEAADAELLAEITAYLESYRRVGHDVRVQQAEYVGIDLALRVCVLPDYLRGHVETALLDALGNRVCADGTKGLFHPDQLTFGESVYASRIIAAAQAIPGVRSVELARLERFEVDEPPLGIEPAEEEVPAGGVLRLGPFEIARLDNDLNYPENGRLTLILEGGR